MATLEESRAEVDRLTKLVEELQNKTTTFSPKVEVSIPPNRKLAKFDGVRTDVRDWVDDAKSAIKGLKNDEQISFLKRHLEGDARREITLQSSSLISKAEDIFTILKDCFGEKRSSAKLKKIIYSRTQKEGESVRDFTRNLMDLVDRLPHESNESRNRILNEAICDNLRSQSVKDEVQKLLEKDISISFADVRARAILLGDRDWEREVQASTNAVSELADCNLGDEVECRALQNKPGKDPIEKLCAAMEKMAEDQHKLITMLQQKPSGMNPPSWSPLPMSSVTPTSFYSSGNRQQDMGEDSIPTAALSTFPPSTAFAPTLSSPVNQPGFWGHVYNVGPYTGLPRGNPPVYGGLGGPGPQCFRCGNFGHIQTSASCPLFDPSRQNFRRKGRGRNQNMERQVPPAPATQQGNLVTPTQ